MDFRPERDALLDLRFSDIKAAAIAFASSSLFSIGDLVNGVYVSSSAGSVT